MNNIYQNKWDRFSSIMTIIVSIILLVSIGFSIKDGGTTSIVVSAVLIALLLLSVLSRPKKTTNTDGHLTIDFPLYKKVLDIKDYSPLTIEKMSSTNSIRLFASGGYFGYSGIWRMYVREKSSWITVISYITDKDKDVVLLVPRTKGKKHVLINANRQWFS